MKEFFVLKYGNFYAVVYGNSITWTELVMNASQFNDYNTVIDYIKTMSIDYRGKFLSIEKYFVKE